MKLILLRHGLRDSGFGDVSLSIQGHEQAEQISQNPTLQKVTQLFASPKKRTQETITPLSQALGLDIQIEPNLDQRRDVEGGHEFEERVRTTLHGAATQAGPEDCVLLCTHSDWLQVALMGLEQWVEDAIMHSLFSCAELKVLSFDNGKWTLETT